ncbi:TetR/AcrR family transcriptional regulator [Actinocrinis puniceicyclus]|uniref:TetR/AcrR family transcriptional regulator n=1 Tax=Actinocrinis puniceicyclus TaxID=977794 RepID=A0A8J8BCI5_9ACTN|nr:TetR/AcrR family transcriptional regulator [Actinocrinis puniceicyclus]MBS2963156.1 TetR/AcrR family transcriptional regulator [Actinocrinis puniceicyclus]
MAAETSAAANRAARQATEHARLSARERLLAAANELFYEEGVNTVGIDRVIERAGVAKATLYSAFGSKDELIRAYLEQRFQARREHTLSGLNPVETAREKLLAVFDVLSESFAKPHYHGCAFVNAAAEARPGSPIETAVDGYRGWMRELLTQLAREAGAADPELLAWQLHLLYDGASVSARMDHTPQAASPARAAAEALISAALD